MFKMFVRVCVCVFSLKKVSLFFLEIRCLHYGIVAMNKNKTNLLYAKKNNNHLSIKFDHLQWYVCVCVYVTIITSTSQTGNVNDF